MITQQLHRILMFVGASVSGIAGLLIAADVVDQSVTAWFVVAGAAVTIVGNQMRVWWPKETEDAPTPISLTPPGPPSGLNRSP